MLTLFYSFSSQQGGKAVVDIAFYTDKKNNPNSKSLLKGVLSLDIPKKHVDVELNLIAVGQTKVNLLFQ